MLRAKLFCFCYCLAILIFNQINYSIAETIDPDTSISVSPDGLLYAADINDGIIVRRISPINNGPIMTDAGRLNYTNDSFIWSRDSTKLLITRVDLNAGWSSLILLDLIKKKREYIHIHGLIYQAIISPNGKSVFVVAGMIPNNDQSILQWQGNNLRSLYSTKYNSNYDLTRISIVDNHTLIGMLESYYNGKIQRKYPLIRFITVNFTKKHISTKISHDELGLWAHISPYSDITKSVLVVIDKKISIKIKDEYLLHVTANMRRNYISKLGVKTTGGTWRILWCNPQKCILCKNTRIGFVTRVVDCTSGTVSQAKLWRWHGILGNDSKGNLFINDRGTPRFIGSAY